MVGFLDFLKSRRGALATAAAGAVIVAAGGAWYTFGPKVPWPPIPSAIVPAGPSQPAAPNSGEGAGSGVSANSAPRPGTKLALAPATDATPAAPSKDAAPSEDATTKANAPPTERPPPPQFDIVRVEPSGESVIAGRGAPGTTIALNDGDKELARAVADANGEVVFLPPPLSPGEHALTLQAAPAGAGAGVSSPSVKVVVPKSGKGAVAVARAAPEQAGAAHADAGAAKPDSGVSPTPPATPKSAPAVAIRSAEAEAGGSFFATGSAPAGSQSRLYLNGAFIGRVIADLNGLWSLKVEKGMQPGHYVVRADEVEPNSGKVIARAEVPFDFPVSLPPAPSVGSSDRIVSSSPQAPKPQIPSKAQPPAEVAASARPVAEPPAAPGASADAVVKELRTTTVVRGDSLWRISRKMLGRGIRYTQIYEANAKQIRNPSLVFPGQVFVLPNDPG